MTSRADKATIDRISKLVAPHSDAQRVELAAVFPFANPEEALRQAIALELAAAIRRAKHEENRAELIDDINKLWREFEIGFQIIERP